MTTQTRIQLKLQRDTGSIFYQDKDDNLAFHIEALGSKSTTQCSERRTPSGQAYPASAAAIRNCEQQVRRAASADNGESAATTDLIKSFFRQHLLKNGERSRCLIPLMKKDGMEALLIAAVVLHLRKDGQGDCEDGDVRRDAAAVRSLHRTLGSLVSVLQQRESVLRYLQENPHVVSGDETEVDEE